MSNGFHGSNPGLLIRYETESIRLGQHIKFCLDFFKRNMVGLTRDQVTLQRKKVLEDFFDKNNLILTAWPQGGYQFRTENLPGILKQSSFLSIPDWDNSQGVQKWESITVSLDGQYIQKKWKDPLSRLYQCPEITLITEISNLIQDHWHEI